jgi:hypothetical protein
MRAAWGDENYMILLLMYGIWTDACFFPQVSQIVGRQINLLLVDRMPFDIESFAHPRSK